ncbi:MAG: hypothetical protein ACI9AR_000604 [Flavobacteriaceae bacterium]|jgi:hypothetical protein
MNEETQEIIEQQISLLPKELKDIVLDTAWIDSLKELSTKHKLTVGQTGIYQKEVLLLLIGITHPDSFESNIETRIPLSKGRIIALVHDTNERIISPIREQLKTTHLELKKQTEPITQPSGSLTTKRMSEPVEIEGQTTSHTLRTKDFDPYHEPIG